MTLGNSQSGAEAAIQLDIFETGPNDVFTAPDYAAFRERLSESNCQRCPDLSEGRAHIVVDRGNPSSKIVAIGEAPGENEDLQGKAFVGRAGQLLDQIMASIGLDTNQDMLIINVVKCRPPANRPPKPQEAANCLPYLRWQLNNVKPKIIILLGATAVKHFLPDSKDNGMKDRVGQFFDVPSFPATKFLVLYHPAYLLRDPRKKVEMADHVKALRQWLDTHNS